MKNSKTINALLIAITAVTVILNIVMYFFLPGKIATQITFSGKPSNNMSTVLYLVLSSLMIGLASGMGIYNDVKKIKYLVIGCVLFAANIAVILYNML
jgi:uncharacterized membrane protein